jgi:hypothetical protein
MALDGLVQFLSTTGLLVVSRALAVLRLMTNSNSVGRTIGNAKTQPTQRQLKHLN